MKRYILTSIIMILAGVCVAQTPDSVASVTGPDTTVEAIDAPIVIPSLFEYPTAPDNLPTIQERADWLLQNFWTPFDFSQTSVSQAALDHAFNVYVSPLRWATPNVAESAIDNLVLKLRKYPMMLYQFTKAAEHNLYTDKAEMWIDGAYLKFVDALLADKKIPQLRKARYKAQKKQLDSSKIGAKMPPFTYVTPSGKKETASFATPFTIIEFGDPFCSECAMYKIALESDKELAQMIENGQLAIYYIVPDAEAAEGWERQLAVYPSTWMRGAGTALDESYDMRQTPSVYLLGRDGVIINKYISTEALREYLRENSHAL